MGTVSKLVKMRLVGYASRGFLNSIATPESIKQAIEDRFAMCFTKSPEVQVIVIPEENNWVATCTVDSSNVSLLECRGWRKDGCCQ